MESPIFSNVRTSPVNSDDAGYLTATLLQEIPAESGNFLWYMTDSVAILQDSYSGVVMNIMDLTLNLQLFSNEGRP